MEEWRKSLSDKERQLHDLASIMLKKELKPKQSEQNNQQDTDSGSYFPDKCHAFRSWLKAKDTKK
jgi:hypothetical protein